MRASPCFARRSIGVACFAFVLASTTTGQALNRIQMDNGGESLWWLQAQTPTHTDPAAGVVDGDFYWQVLPAYASRSCDGLMQFSGIESVNFDLDWELSEVLYGWMISSSHTSTAGWLYPDFLDAPVSPEIYVPEFAPVALPFLGNPNGPGGCPPPHYISGWVIQDVIADTAGVPVQLTADGSKDWCFTHLFPGGMDLSNPDPNTCGSTSAGYGGDYTFSFLGSHDHLVSGHGENQPDLLGDGNNPYHGVGSPGAFGYPAPLDYNGGAELAFLFAEPTLQGHVDTGAGLLALGPEMGLAASHFGVGLSCPAGTPLGTGASIGAKMFDQAAQPGDAAVFFGNIGPSLLDLGVGCIPFAGASLGLNPADSAFLPVLTSFGVSPFGAEVSGQQFGGDYGGFTMGDTVATSNQVPLSAATCAWVGLSLQLQGFRLSGQTLVSETNLWTIFFHSSDTIQ